ncbi:hypothetical protein BGZ68_010100 [Mortierella alpina]|nr:hypothetical protein BGZ68_010100 [Mortierella alpina]
MSKSTDYTDSLVLPPRGHVTLGESDSTLVHISGPQDPELQRFIKKHGELKAALTMPSRNTHIPHHPKLNAAVDELLATSKATGVIPQPILDKIDELRKQWDLDAIADAAGALWKKAWDVYISLSGSYDTIVRHDKLAKLLIRKVACHPHQSLVAIALWNDSVWVYDLSVESWYSCGLSHPAQSRIMSMEWKPMSGVVLAIGCSDGIALWDVYRDHSPTSANNPWTDAPDPLKVRPAEALSEIYCTPTRTMNHGRDTAWLGMKTFEQLGGVDQLAWDTRGEFLALGSAHSSTVYILEHATVNVTELRFNMRITPPRFVRSAESFAETVSNVKRALGTATSPNLQASVLNPTHEKSHFGPTVTCMRWSPSGEYLLVAHQSEEARIYETTTWTHADIKDLKGAIQSACWTPDSYNLIYSLQGDDDIRGLHLEKRGGALTWIPLMSAKMAMQPNDISRYRIAIKKDQDDTAYDELREQYWKQHGGRILQNLTAFGPIEELVLDPNGVRLVVRFRDSELLGVVVVKQTGSMLKDLEIFTPTGFIQGPGWNGKEVVGGADEEDGDGREPKATALSFVKQFNGGSLLVAAWESGRINFVPFYYRSP